MKTIKIHRAFGLTCVLLITGCASHPGPIIDKRGVNMEAYAQDLAECTEYADDVSVAEGAVRGAAVGAVIGAAVGSISGNVDEGAGYGAASGGVRSGLRNKNTKENVVKRCLSGRGYRVLN